MKSLVIAVVLGISSFTLFGQGGNISGTVLDQQSGEPLVGAKVVHKTTGIETITDFDGGFSFENVNAGVNELSISYVSYNDAALKRVIVKEGESTDLNIKMSRAHQRMNQSYMASRQGVVSNT